MTTQEMEQRINFMMGHTAPLEEFKPHQAMLLIEVVQELVKREIVRELENKRSV